MAVQFNKRVVTLPAYPFTKLAAVRAGLIEKGLRVFDFTKGDPVEPTPSFICEAFKRGVPAISQYPVFKGTPELRQSIRNYMQRRFGVVLDADRHILQSNGSKEAIYNLTSVLIGPESERTLVIGPDPGYPVVERSCLLFGAQFFPVQLRPDNGYLLELSELPDQVLRSAAAVWLNYPHNPTAACANLEYFKRQYSLCQKYGILLCSDECYVDMSLEGEPPPSALQLGLEGILAFHSCSKRSGMTGYRTGFIAGDPEVIRIYLSIRDAIGTETSVMVQAAATAAWNDDAHVVERQAIFKQKRDLFLDFFNSQGLACAPCNATFYLWLKVPTNVSGEEYARRLSEFGILVTPGSYFGAGCEDRVRVALVPSLNESKDALAKWAECHARYPVA